MRRKEMISREQNGENVYWCKGVKGWKNVLKCFWTESRETKPNQTNHNGQCEWEKISLRANKNP